MMKHNSDSTREQKGETMNEREKMKEKKTERKRRLKKIFHNSKFWRKLKAAFSEIWRKLVVVDLTVLHHQQN